MLRGGKVTKSEITTIELCDGTVNVKCGWGFKININKK